MPESIQLDTYVHRRPGSMAAYGSEKKLRKSTTGP